MREHTSDMYRIQEENTMTEGGIPQYNNQRGFIPGGLRRIWQRSR
jgi:hypothetical protein